MKVRPLGDTAFVIELEDKPASILRVSRLASILQHDPPPGVVEAQAAFSGLTVFYDPVAVLDWKGLAAAIAGAFPASDPGPGRPVIEIKVDYGGERGPDLESVARHARLSPAEVIAAHSAIEYTAAAVGFVPGFAYLEGLPPALHAPRRATPRTQVPAGSVGIGGRYTGIYPFAVPGGWNLIGRTDLSLFDASRSEPALIRPGDRVRFIQSAMSRNT